MKSLITQFKKNKLANLVLVLLISLGFIAYQLRTVDLQHVWKGLRNADIGWLLGAMLIMVGYWFLEALVLHRMSEKVHKSQTIWQSIKVTMIGQFFNTITPFSSGGQPAQLYTMMKNGVSVGIGSSILLIKFIIFQAMLVISSMIILLFGYGYIQNQSIPQLNLLIIVGFILNLIVIVTLITIAKSKRVAHIIAHTILLPVSFFVKKERYIIWKEKLNDKLDSFHEESNRMSFDWKLLAQCSVLTLIQLWLFFSIPYFILQGLGIGHVSIFQVIAFHSFIMMFASLVPIPGGSGGAEYSFLLLFGLILKPALLILCLFFWRMITYYSCILFGSLFLLAKTE